MGRENYYHSNIILTNNLLNSKYINRSTTTTMFRGYSSSSVIFNNNMMMSILMIILISCYTIMIDYHDSVTMVNGRLQRMNSGGGNVSDCIENNISAINDLASTEQRPPEEVIGDKDDT